jgi:hypothetical protein
MIYKNTLFQLAMIFLAGIITLSSCDAQRGGILRSRQAASPGQAFPAFQGTTLNGRPVDNFIFEGHVTLVSAWRIGCEWSIVEIAEYNKLHDTLRDPRFQLISMTPQSREELSELFARHNAGTPGFPGELVPRYDVLPMCTEEHARPADAGDGRCTVLEELLGAEVYPITFVVGPDGVIRHRHDGLIVHPETFEPDITEFRLELDSLLRVL